MLGSFSTSPREPQPSVLHRDDGVGVDKLHAQEQAPPPPPKPRKSSASPKRRESKEGKEKGKDSSSNGTSSDEKPAPSSGIDGAAKKTATATPISAKTLPSRLVLH